MSRAYRISITEGLSRHVQVDDGVCSNLELLPILEQDRMGALLSAELEGKGFKREGNDAVRDEGKGVTTRIDVKTGAVSVTAEGHQALDLKATRTALADGPNQKTEDALRTAAQEQLERDAKAEEEALRRTVTRQLEAKLKDLKGELDQVVNKVTANALKARAAELGTVEEVHEDPGGNLTIRVRV